MRRPSVSGRVDGSATALDGADPDGVPRPARHLATLLTALPIVLVAALPAPARPASGCADARLMPDRGNLDRIRAATLCLLNAERASRGLARLKSSGELRKAARAHSANMVRRRFFAHDCPDGSTVDSRIGDTDYLRGRLRRWTLGENIGWGWGNRATPEAMMHAWMDSKVHRDNILDEGFRHVGVGIVAGAPEDVGGRPAATYTTDFGLRVKP